jgi:hypothetical protein
MRTFTRLAAVSAIAGLLTGGALTAASAATTSLSHGARQALWQWESRQLPYASL